MKIVNFNTAYATFNLGDFIIVDAVHREMDYLFRNNFVCELPTHTPVTTFIQSFSRNRNMKFLDEAEYKFVDGTHILNKSLLKVYPGWNVSILNCKPYRNSVLVGVGMAGDFRKPNIYTKMIYRKILSKKYIHSTRDEKTKRLLEAMGYKAINTGCPTLWMLTEEFCKGIPRKKARDVVFTLTDYKRDEEKDKQLIDILKNHYNTVHFWIQGSRDLEYFKTLDNTDDIELIPPNLEAYEELLKRGNIDYVGTRLHAGIFAMRHKVRSIIIVIDNRARDMQETYNLVTIERSNIEQLGSLIESSFETSVKIDVKKIAKWKAQFRDE